MPKVEVEILPSGEVRVHVLGVAGPSCVPLTKALEESLGSVEQVVKTGEFYQTSRTSTAAGKRTVTQ